MGLACVFNVESSPHLVHCIVWFAVVIETSINSEGCPLLQNASGHVFCPACQQYFADASQKDAVQLQVADSAASHAPTDIVQRNPDVQSARDTHAVDLHEWGDEQKFAAAAGPEEHTHFRQLFKLQASLRAANDVDSSRR